MHHVPVLLVSIAVPQCSSSRKRSDDDRLALTESVESQRSDRGQCSLVQSQGERTPELLAGLLCRKSEDRKVTRPPHSPLHKGHAPLPPPPLLPQLPTQPKTVHVSEQVLDQSWLLLTSQGMSAPVGSGNESLSPCVNRRGERALHAPKRQPLPRLPSRRLGRTSFLRCLAPASETGSRVSPTPGTEQGLSESSPAAATAQLEARACPALCHLPCGLGRVTLLL